MGEVGVETTGVHCCREKENVVKPRNPQWNSNDRLVRHTCICTCVYIVCMYTFVLLSMENLTHSAELSELSIISQVLTIEGYLLSRIPLDYNYYYDCIQY